VFAGGAASEFELAGGDVHGAFVLDCKADGQTTATLRLFDLAGVLEQRFFG
jgi:hypothetical protein